MVKDTRCSRLNEQKRETVRAACELGQWVKMGVKLGGNEEEEKRMKAECKGRKMRIT